MRTGQERHDNDRPQKSGRNFRLLPMWLLSWLFLLLILSSCRYATPVVETENLSQNARDSLHYLYRYHYTFGTNLEVRRDSVALVCLPLKGRFFHLYRGDKAVVTEFAIHPADSVDSVWVRLAASQEVQGWLRECELKEMLMPSDSISQIVCFFSDGSFPYFAAVSLVMLVAWGCFLARHRRLKRVCLDDIDTVYPLLLCLLTAFTAVLYAAMQLFWPEMWEHFYFNPTLAPWEVPLPLSLFLLGVWLMLVLLLAVADELFHRFSPSMALLCLLGWVPACIACYCFFVWTASFYAGFLLFPLFAGLCIGRMIRVLRKPRYRCGNCGNRLDGTGVCPHCGAVNE